MDLNGDRQNDSKTKRPAAPATLMAMLVERRLADTAAAANQTEGPARFEAEWWRNIAHQIGLFSGIPDPMPLRPRERVRWTAPPGSFPSQRPADPISS